MGIYIIFGRAYALFLFLIFINDVVSTCLGNTTVNMFADDLKVEKIGSF